MLEDTSSTLGDIRDRCPNGLVSQLLEIQKHRFIEAKSLEWARNPTCLHIVSPNSSRKRKRGADNIPIPNASKTFRRTPHSGPNYVAVSYTCCPSEHEQESSAVGGYRIMESPRGNLTFETPSKVRDCILERAINYANHRETQFIWIDDECINRHNQDEHEIAMQSMDLIYNFSKYPVGLLTKPIRSHEDLDLLWRLLHSDFVEIAGRRRRPVLKSGITAEVALMVLNILDHITSDKWWTRAWIFQEAYRSSVKMILLIPLPFRPSRIQARRKWCSMPGELQVKSADFHEQSTFFCLAFLSKVGAQWRAGDSRKKCEDVLKRAKKYNVLYRYGHLIDHESARKSMSPSIFTDIGSRQISVASDLLAIAANCCNYSIRLNTKSLKPTFHSLSLAILALFLLNGDIIKNNEDDESLMSKNISSYLQELALNFDPPVEAKELTFIKHCRLVNVRLSEEGIVTSGSLWKLRKAIDTGSFTSRPQAEREFPDGLNSYQRSQLRRLSKELWTQGYKALAKDLDDYLQEDAEDQSKPSKQFKDLMAETVVEAIRTGKTIHLAYLVGCDKNSPYRGVFVTNPAMRTPSYVFTAWRSAGYGGKASDKVHAERLLDKFISMEVEATNLEGLPRLKTKGCINGLFFFDGVQPRDVIFPYPKSLTG